jgi:hypothetical protein
MKFVSDYYVQDIANTLCHLITIIWWKMGKKESSDMTSPPFLKSYSEACNVKKVCQEDLLDKGRFTKISTVYTEPIEYHQDSKSLVYGYTSVCYLSFFRLNIF